MLLLDEPFGALDAKVRKELRRWLRRLHDELHITSVFVTHDQEEALEVADHVVVLNKGKIEQVGAPDEVYDKPATPFVYQFLGNVNLFHSRVHGGFAKVGELELPVDGHDNASNAPASAYVRPHDIEILRSPENGSSFAATVSHIHAIGPIVRLELAREDATEIVEAELTRERYQELNLKSGERVYLKPRNLRVFLTEPAA